MLSAQIINQTYNFGLNSANACAGNELSSQELALSYTVAVSMAVGGSLGLKMLFEKLKIPGAFGRGLIMFTPLFGLVSANTANLFFSRFKDIKEGIPVLNPATNQPVQGAKSKKAGMSNFIDSMFLRIMISIPIFTFPMVMSKIAKKQFRWYSKTVPSLLFDASKIKNFLIFRHLLPRH